MYIHNYVAIIIIMIILFNAIVSITVPTQAGPHEVNTWTIMIWNNYNYSEH